MSRVVQDVQSTLQQPAAPAGVLERLMGALTDLSPQALVLFCRQFQIQELCPGTRAILARLMTIQNAPFGGGPVLARPAQRSRTNRGSSALRPVKPLPLADPDSAS